MSALDRQALGRVLTIYLQSSGHTCGIEDLTLTARAEENRRSIINKVNRHGFNQRATPVVPGSLHESFPPCVRSCAILLNKANFDHNTSFRLRCLYPPVIWPSCTVGLDTERCELIFLTPRTLASVQYGPLSPARLHISVILPPCVGLRGTARCLTADV